MKYMKLLALSLVLLVSFGYAGIVHALSTTEPASQVVSYYNTDETNAYIQITNTNLGSPVDIHVQILDEDCDEVDFFRVLTPLDTDVINIDAVSGAGTRGIVIINAVEGPGDFDPIDFPHLIATTTLVDDDSESDGDFAYNINALGRQLVGGAWELHQPEDVLSPIDVVFLYDENEFISLAWEDIFAGGYIAKVGVAFTTNPLVGVFIIDDAEVKDSCGQFDVVCVSELGPTLAAPSHLDPDPGNLYVCDKSTETLGLVQLLDIDTLDFLGDGNYAAIAGGNNSEYAGLHYVTEVAAAPAPTPPPVDCTADPCSKLPDCTSECEDITCTDLASCSNTVCDGVEVVDGATCSGGEATETDCADETDNDGDGSEDCDDSDCENDTACIIDIVISSDSGCSVATAATGLGSMASALVLLVPAFGIGARRIRKRLSK
jgi:hypothetical protein